MGVTARSKTHPDVPQADFAPSALFVPSSFGIPSRMDVDAVADSNDTSGPPRVIRAQSETIGTGKSAIGDGVGIVQPPVNPRLPLHKPAVQRLGNFFLSSCPGKKVRLQGPVKGRGTICRDVRADLARVRDLGVKCVIW